MLSSGIKNALNYERFDFGQIETNDDHVSFAEAMPNNLTYQNLNFEESMDRILSKRKYDIFKYGDVAGLNDLRYIIANHYSKKLGCNLNIQDIIITTGSQQSIYLLSQILLNKNDSIIIEEPSYLGAINAFSFFEPKFLTINISSLGFDIGVLENIISNNNIKFIYLIPNYQNPTSYLYTYDERKRIRSLIDKHNILLIEDDPYGALNFKDINHDYISKDIIDKSVLLGTFSKILMPGLRLGYIITKNKILKDNLLVAKEAIDIHTDNVSQSLLYDYLINNNFQEHIRKSKILYSKLCKTMADEIRRNFPSNIEFIEPLGGMFIWLTCNHRLDIERILIRATENNVHFAPGYLFYCNNPNKHTMRLNFTYESNDKIVKGIQILGEIMNKEIEEKQIE